MEALSFFVASLPKAEQIGILFIHEDILTIVNVSYLCTAKVSYASISKAISLSPHVVCLNDSSFELRMLPTERFVGCLKAKGVETMQSKSSLTASKTLFRLQAEEGQLVFDVMEQKFDGFRYYLGEYPQMMPWGQISVKKAAQQLILSTFFQKGVRYQSVADYRTIRVNVSDCVLLEHLFVYFAAMTGFVQKVVLNNEIHAFQKKSQKFMVYEQSSIYEKPKAASSIENRFSYLLKTLSHEEIEQKPFVSRNGLASTNPNLLASRRVNSTTALLTSMLLRTDPCLQTSTRFAQHGCHTEAYNTGHLAGKANELTQEILQTSELDKPTKQYPAITVSQAKSQLFASEGLQRLSRHSAYNSFCQTQSKSEAIEPLASVTKVYFIAPDVQLDSTALEAVFQHLYQDISNYQYREQFASQVLEFYQAMRLNCAGKRELANLIVWLYKFIRLEPFCRAYNTAMQFASIDHQKCSMVEAIQELMVKLAAMVASSPCASRDIYSGLINILVAGYILQFLTGKYPVHFDKNAHDTFSALLTPEKTASTRYKQRHAQIGQMLLLLEAVAIERYAVLQFEMHNFVGFTGAMQAAIDRFEGLEASCASHFLSKNACKELPGRARHLKHKLYKASADILLKQSKTAQAFADAAYCSSIGGKINLEKYTSRFCEILQESRYLATEIDFSQLFREFGVARSYFVLCKPINFASIVQNRQAEEAQTHSVGRIDCQDAYVYADGAFRKVQAELRKTGSAKVLCLKYDSSAFSIELRTTENTFPVRNRAALRQIQSLGSSYAALGVEYEGSEWILAVPYQLLDIFLY